MLKLLIADDEKETRQGIRQMVSWEKYDIELCPEAANGKEAINLICSEHPDIVLLDVRMPLIDGLGVVKYIFKHQLNIQTVILSGYDEFSYAQTAIKYGVTDYLLKPCRMEDILNSILKCKDNLSQKSFLKGITQPFFTDLETTQQLSKEEETQIFLLFDSQKEKLLNAIRSGNTTEAVNLTHSMFLSFGESSCTKNAIINYILTFMVELTRLETQCSIPRSDDLYTLTDFQQLICHSTLSDLEKTVSSIILGVTEKINEKSEKSIPVFSAINYIETHYQENLDLNTLSKRVHVTPAYLSLLFKMQTGTNFLEYLTRYRIEKACELLKSTSLKNYEIAFQTGFRDEKYFSTIFKKQMGMPPSRYRKIYS